MCGGRTSYVVHLFTRHRHNIRTHHGAFLLCLEGTVCTEKCIPCETETGEEEEGERQGYASCTIQVRHEVFYIPYHPVPEFREAMLSHAVMMSSCNLVDGWPQIENVDDTPSTFVWRETMVS